MKSLKTRLIQYSCGLVMGFFFMGLGCVDLTPAWEKTSRSISNNAGGVSAPDGNGVSETGGIGGGDDALIDVGTGSGGGGALENSDSHGLPGGSLAAGGSSGGTASSGGGLAAGGNGGTASSGNGGTASSGNGGISSGGANGGSSGETGDGEPCAADGKFDSGICWYFGNAGASCATTCSTHGGTSPLAASMIGTPSQGGSLAKCIQLMELFGMSTIVIEKTRSDGIGLGCYKLMTISFINYWLSQPNYADTAKMNNVRVMCGCMN